MAERPPLYNQETPYSCAPACLRMVLQSFGVSKTEQELREMCDCLPLSIGGVSEALKLVDAARGLGFQKTRKYNLTLADLKSELARGLFPIAYIRTQLTPGEPADYHSVVVSEIRAGYVELNDPWRGAIAVTENEFSAEWAAMHNLTILVE
jgi:ABC-type bacteriocin/lantibiotic exporter with double-glycine peptidase domain